MRIDEGRRKFRRSDFRRSQAPARFGAWDSSVEGVAAIAARGEEAFSFRVQWRGSRPRLQPSEVLGLFNQFVGIRVRLRERRLAKNGDEQAEADTPKKRAAGSPGHISFSISRGAYPFLQPQAD